MMRKLGVVVMVIVVLALAACTSSPTVSPTSTTTTQPLNGNVVGKLYGALTGTFVAIDGLPGPPRPLPGKVTAKDSAGHKFTVAIGKSGKFVMSLRAGVYRLTGRSPMVTVNGVEPTCGIFAPPVHVRAEKETRGVQVVCPLK